MELLVLVTLALIMAGTLLLWPKPEAGEDGKGDGGPGSGKSDGEQRTGPTTLEGALVAQLVSGEISRIQYQNALAGLAAWDDQRHPMSVPGDDRPDAHA